MNDYIPNRFAGNAIPPKTVLRLSDDDGNVPAPDPNEICFVVYGNPIALKRHRTFRRGNFIGRYDPSAEDKANFLAKCQEYRPARPLDGALRISVSCFFSRPKSHYKTSKREGTKLREDAPQYHTKTPDGDNLLKFVCDALNGVFWIDDKQICDSLVMKRYADDMPRIVVTVTQMSE